MGDDDILILIGLAAIAGFLLLRLRNVLGERDGFEDPERMRRAKEQIQSEAAADNANGVVTPLPQRASNEQDDDIFAYAEPNSELGQALREIKSADPSFQVGAFMDGARGAYELILTGFENGDKKAFKPFLDGDVFTAFSEAIDQREQAQLSVEMKFVGFKSSEPTEATFDPQTRRAEITVRFVAEVITATRDATGEVVDGDPAQVRRINDVWTFARTMPSNDPVWILVATDG